MNRTQNPTPSQRESSSNEETAPAAAQAAASSTSPDADARAKADSARRVFGEGPRLWALPDKNLGWWIVRENDKDSATLIEGMPSIFIPNLSTERKTEVAQRCREFVGGRLRDHWQEDLFELIKRMLLGGIFTLGGIAALRFIEYFDIPLLLTALGYSAYAGIRYGMRFLHSYELAHRPYSNFMGEPFVASTLVERISAALEYRRSLPPEKRGEAPDLELLDANSYRKLIREGVITRDQLCALGRAVQTRLDVSLSSPKKISALSSEEGLDAESAALYRDLALAAAEIEFDGEFK